LGRKILLLGQPNVGKSTLLNALTGAGVHTSNYPGTTVEVTKAEALLEGAEYEFIDTPGIYNLFPSSMEEEVTERVLIEEEYEAVVVVTDATAIERSLVFALSVLELGVPAVIALNFWEEAERRGISINYGGLENELGIPIVRVNPLKKGGLNELIKRLKEARPSKLKIIYDDHVERAIAEVIKCVKTPKKLSRRGIAVRLIEGDPIFCRLYSCRCAEAARKELVKVAHDPYKDIEVGRAGYAMELSRKYVRIHPTLIPGLSRLDKALIINPPLGLLASLLSISALILATIVAGNVLIDLINIGFGSYVDSLTSALSTQGFIGLMASMSVKALYGQYVAAFPYVFIFYLFLVLLEDSGLLARIMIWLHAFTKKIGLHSKGVIPVLLGLGCSVPATIGTRILPGRKQKVVAISMLAFIPCSSRASIVFGVAGRILGPQYSLAVYLLGFTLAVVIGYVISKALKAGEEAVLIEDIPPMRAPKAKTVMSKTWLRLKSFIIVVTPLVIVGALIYAAAVYIHLDVAIIDSLAPIASVLKLPPGTLIPLAYGFLQKDLVISMLATVLGTVNFGNVLTPHQIMTFTITSTYQVPCIIALGAMIRELGFKKAIPLWILLDLVGFAVAVIYAQL